MLNNRRRASSAQLRWASLRATLSMVLLNPIAVVFPGFVLAGIAVIAARELAPHYWPGACYEAHLEARGRLGNQMPVCVKHVPFVYGDSTTHSS